MLTLQRPFENVNKRQLAQLVAERLKHHYKIEYVMNVISLFLDQFSVELQTLKPINIPCFGYFRIEKSKPRKFFHIGEQRFSVSRGNYLLKITIDPLLKRKIIRNIDLLKTFT